MRLFNVRTKRSMSWGEKGQASGAVLYSQCVSHKSRIRISGALLESSSELLSSANFPSMSDGSARARCAGKLPTGIQTEYIYMNLFESSFETALYSRALMPWPNLVEKTGRIRKSSAVVPHKRKQGWKTGRLSFEPPRSILHQQFSTNLGDTLSIDTDREKFTQKSRGRKSRATKKRTFGRFCSVVFGITSIHQLTKQPLGEIGRNKKVLLKEKL